MNIVFVASEATPFIKTGGLADVIGSLPKALQEEGNSVHVIIPKYKLIAEEFKQQMETVYRGNISLGWRQQYCGVDVLKQDGITYYFIDNEYYFGRDQIYGYSDAFDEAERFIFFSKAMLEVLPQLMDSPDILHLHDWQTAMVSIYMHAIYKQQAYYKNVKTVFTVHNLKYQGVFSRDLLGDVIELDRAYFHTEALEYHGCLNLMKGALLYSDVITTVSDTYTKEIQYPFFGEGLDGLLRKRQKELYGIVNGIDTASYNSNTDLALTTRFNDLKGKYENKIALQQKVGLPIKSVPMVAIISRLVEQKGLDLFIHIMDELLEDDIQVVILGTGEDKYQHLLSEIGSKHSDKVALQFFFDEGLSRQIYAAADLLLVPSLFEPCGLSQLIALRYGAVPVVRETGGLKDTIKPFNEVTKEGNGFSFTNYNAHDLLFTIRRALSFYNDKTMWEQIVANGRLEDFSWNQSAKKYNEIYEQLCPKQGTVTS